MTVKVAIKSKFFNEIFTRPIFTRPILTKPIFFRPIFFEDEFSRKCLLREFEAEDLIPAMLQLYPELLQVKEYQTSRLNFLKKKRLILLSQLALILRKSREISIEPVLLKGLAFEQTFYPSNIVRNFNDIDLLIKEDEFYRFKSLLEELGFKSKELSVKQLNYELNTQHAVSFINDEIGLEVDLHWNLIQSQYGVNTSGLKSFLFRDLKTAEYQNISFLTLNPELHLYFICLHAYKNLFSNYKDLLDIFYAAQSPQINYNKFIDYVQKSKTEQIINTAIYLSNKTWGGDAFYFLSQKEVEIAEEIFEKKILSKESSELENIKLEFLLRKSFLSKLNYLVLRTTIPHDKDWDLKIPDRLFFLYKVMKPLRTLKDIIFKILKVGLRKSFSD